jgi:hypothetical protein
MDVLAEFGFKMETAKKESAKPEEHRTNGANEPKAETEVVEEDDSVVESEERKDA